MNRDVLRSFRSNSYKKAIGKTPKHLYISHTKIVSCINGGEVVSDIFAITKG